MAKHRSKWGGRRMRENHREVMLALELFSKPDTSAICAACRAHDHDCCIGIGYCPCICFNCACKKGSK